jgi:DNA invertase Pin-like site-specific DNA recombinase
VKGLPSPKKGLYRGWMSVMTSAQIQLLRDRLTAGAPKAQIARQLGVSRSTLYRYLRHGEAVPYPIMGGDKIGGR